MLLTRLLLIVTLCLLAESARAQYSGMAPKSGDSGSNADKKAGYEQNLGARIPLELEFFDHNNDTVKLGDLLGGKPAIFVMAYYRCPQLCNEVLQHLLESMRVLANGGFVCGRDYNVITVGIDPKESYHLTRPKRMKFYEELDGRSAETPGWWFLTASHGQGTDIKAAEAKIHLLANTVGFTYTLKHKNTEYSFDEKDGVWRSQAGSPLRDDAREYEYIHASGIMIVTPEGRISQYFMGHSGEKAPDSNDPIGARPYRARDIRLALVEASGGKVGTKIDQIMLYCYMYDVKTGTYVPVMRTLGLVSLPFVFLLVGITILAVRNARKVGNPLPPIVAAGGTS
jgi:protein SCO1